ncbi:putative bifunctional diguanylate cyclase/phosphodiesterase [Metasolibacillus fluoroglycofenilyticus]|uniref:putative bifunctional diguanylate cyclase/phosphodiesterase n=1 Tax=Metasolibacillus fluoroglycofenilyticus TaxID=1239396 RepID=UPI000D350E04|nr:GGDEF domain-containing phosphodiesterase [Metasolibacillus fluoroglycofenilyticus]
MSSKDFTHNNMDIEHSSVYKTSLVKVIFENVEEGIMITNEKKCIIAVNPAFEFVTGYSLSEVIGNTPAILQSGMHDSSFYKKMWAKIEKDGMWQGEIWNRRKTGDIYPEWLTIIAVKDGDNNIMNYCGIFTDLSERKSVESELKKRTLTDLLTKVNNRFAYLERMKALLLTSATATTPMRHAIYFLDIDRFKQVNEVFGHAVGDKLLIAVAKRIRRLLKNKDILARYGDDEFAITLTNIVHPREAAKFAQQVLHAMEQPFIIDGQEIFISVSIGISLYPLDGGTTDELVHRADKAMYFSRQTGPGNFAFFIEDLEIDTKRVSLLDTELRKAIENNDFQLYFQPKVSLKTKQVIGVEALVRWTNDKLGQVSPGEFIPYSEETGLIIPLSEMIIEMACSAFHVLRANGYANVPIALNISSIHFQQQNFLETIQKILEKNNTSAHNFEIEVTERTVLDNSSEAISKFDRLKQLGFTLSIDDFGTGYSSLSYLIRFPFDVLKIDRSFVQHICSSEEKQGVVDAIIQMAHRLNMQVVAEGVESKQQVQLLQEIDCDFAQGFHYSKPMPLGELLQFLAYWEHIQ